jgi:hypothetical protein
MIHEIDTPPDEFSLLWSGIKRFSIQRAARKINAGDYIIFREYDPSIAAATGGTICVEVKYVARGGQSGLSLDMVVLSLSEFMLKQDDPFPVVSEPSMGDLA